MYSSVDFYICIHSYNHHPDHIKDNSSTLEDFFMSLCYQYSPSRENNCFDFYHYRLVLPGLEHHIDGTLEYLFFCVWHLSCSMSVRLIYVASSVVCSYLLVYRISFFEYATIYLFLLMYFWSYFQFGALMDKSIRNILVCLLLNFYTHFPHVYT